MNKNRNTIIWVIVVILVVAAISIGYYRYQKDWGTGGDLQGTTPIATEGGAAGSGATGGLVSDVTATSLSYSQAVAIFANERVQFDENCRMTPISMAIKNGTTVMFDNRSRDARTFKLDGTKYSLAGYGFKLFQLTAARIPHNIDVDCGNNQNSGKINLE